jgi:membrane glycosyltransferase
MTASFVAIVASTPSEKAGNISDWVRHFGGAYPQIIILDADSVMSGEAIVRLAAAMSAHPDVGLTQTLLIIVNGTSLFARMQQFAGRVYGPLIAHGIAWSHGAEANYWGHNAMIRTVAFASQAGLPTLRGPNRSADTSSATILSRPRYCGAVTGRFTWSRS